MPFDGYLNAQEIRELTNAAVASDLVEVNRTLLLQGILKTYRFALTLHNNPLDQFALTLAQMNGVERLANGEIPLAQMLQNAAEYLKLRGLPEGDIFERFANRIGNSARGVPTLPDPSQLPEIIQNQAIVGRDDMVNFFFLARAAAVGKSVARIKTPRFQNGQAVVTTGGAPSIMLGTAWMIAPTLMVTNHHVVNSRLSRDPDASPEDLELQCAKSMVEFDYDTLEGAGTEANVRKLEAHSSKLDYAVLRLEEDPRRDVLSLIKQQVAVNSTTYLPVNIIQHAGGRHKQVAFRNNLVSGADNEILRYFTDTDIGSSGSPVCDDQWRVLALHRGASHVQGVSYQGKTTAFVNFGTQIQSILNDLKSRNGDIFAEIVASQP